MDRYQEMSILLAIAETQGFASAARRLQLSPASVTRSIAALERRIGTTLLTRTTRSVRLTEAGERFVLDCRRLLAAVDEAEESAAGMHATPRGHLSIATPILFGQGLLMPIVRDYLDAHPQVTARVMLVDRLVQLADEGVDVALRMGALPDSSMSAMVVGAIRRVVCATPAYLAELGTPAHPADLARHRVILSSADARGGDWHFDTHDGDLLEHVEPILTVSTNQAAIIAAGTGFGLTRVMSYQIAEELQSGALIRVLTDFEPPPIHVHLLYQEGRRASAKVRSFVEYAAARLRAHNALH